MKDLFFWLQWKSSYRTLYVALLILFLASITSVVFAYLYGDIYTIGWNTTSEWKNIALSLDVFQINQFDISQESQQYFLLNRYSAGDLTIHPWLSYTFISFVLIAFVVLLTVISYVDLWLYIAGMMMFAFFIVSMQLEQLGIFGLYNRLPTVLTLIAFGSLTYYFNSYGKQISLFKRLFSIAGLLIALISLILFGSSIEVPLLYVANYAIVIPIIICIIFMLMVAYDILQFLVILTSYGKSEYKPSGNSIWSFMILGTIYLTNLFLIYFQPDFIKAMDIVLLQPIAVLIVSAILGIWLFEMKEEVAGVLPFKPLGAILYLAIGIIAFGTIAFGYATANDALTTTLEKSALYIQLGMGIGIFVYVISNFWNKYKKQVEVYKHFYIAYQVPFFVGRGFGWAIIMYFVFTSNRFVYFSGKAAYYNNVADVYLYTGQDVLAESFYKESFTQEFQNQRCNYSLANFYEQRDDKTNAFKYYENSLNKKPSVFAYASLSNFYIKNNQLFPAIFMLQDGLKDYPKNPQLLNNLGYLYTRFNTPDSAAYFFSKAAGYSNDDIPLANMLAYFGSAGKFEACDVIIKNEPSKPSATFIANKIGVNTLQGKSDISEIPQSVGTDSILNAETFTLLYNYTINQLSKPDTTLDQKLQKFSEVADNEAYKVNLLYAKALHLYYSKTNVSEAFILLEQVVELDRSPVFTITLADWQLKAGLYQQAYERYQTLIAYSDQRIVARKCLAAMEYGNDQSVSDIVIELAKSQTPQVATIGKTLKAALSKPAFHAYDSLSNQEKAQCLHYHSLPKAELSLFKNSIQDPVQALILDIEQIEKLNNQQEFEAAMSLWNGLNKSIEVPPNVLAQGNLEYLKILVGLKQWDVLKKELKSTALLSKDLGYIDYFSALALKDGKDSAAAKPYFERAIQRIGYVPAVQIDYANYLAKMTGEVEAVEQLVEAKKFISYSKPLSMAYIDACITLGLFKSAENELDAAASTLTDAEIAAIKNKFYSSPTWE